MVKRNRVSIDLSEEFYNIAKQEADKKFLSLTIYLRSVLYIYFTQLVKRRSKDG